MAVAALEVDVAAAEEDVDGLADAVEQVVGRGIDGTDALELGADEMWAFVAHEVTLTLFLGAAGYGSARLQDVEAGGAGLFGHRGPSSQSTSEVSACCSAKNEAEPRKLLQDMVQYRIARDA